MPDPRVSDRATRVAAAAGSGASMLRTRPTGVPASASRCSRPRSCAPACGSSGEAGSRASGWHSPARSARPARGGAPAALEVGQRLRRLPERLAVEADDAAEQLAVIRRALKRRGPPSTAAARSPPAPRLARSRRAAARPRDETTRPPSASPSRSPTRPPDTAQAMPQVLGRRDHQRRRAVLVKEATADEILAAAPVIALALERLSTIPTRSPSVSPRPAFVARNPVDARTCARKGCERSS